MDKSPLAWSHMFPPQISQRQSESAVKLRYDGATIDGQPVFFCVINQADLSRLGSDALSGLVFDNTSDAFFVGTELDLNLYVDMDAHPDFIDTIIDRANERGISVLNGAGDLEAMMDADRNLVAPDVPAFIENGVGHVPATYALSFIDKGKVSDGPEFG